jgi:hypothetical protein
LDSLCIVPHVLALTFLDCWLFSHR